MAADLGQGEELSGLEEKGKKTGASKVYVEDLRHEFVTGYIYPTMKAGAIYERKYLLGTSFARPLIAKRQIEIAEKEGADAVAHGCTGRGNDQVRFELTYKALNPNIKIIAPWREWDIKTREEELDYAIARGIPVTATKEKNYSEDRNIWHLSHEGGLLEEPWNEPSEDMFSLTTPPAQTPDEPMYVDIEFEEGIPVRVNGQTLGPVELLSKLNEIGGAYGIGRIDMVENRLVGMKSRGVYETPGGTLLYAAHADLESITLERETLHYKDLVAQRYAELVYYGKWFSPLKKALDAFMDSTQETVMGTVRLKLYKGSCAAVARKSPYSLYRQDLGSFDDVTYDHMDAAGFINLFGLPERTQAMLDAELKR